MDKFFTNGFYKFLLGFSVIILVSFGVLAFLGSQQETQLETSTQTAQ